MEEYVFILVFIEQAELCDAHVHISLHCTLPVVPYSAVYADLTPLKDQYQSRSDGSESPSKQSPHQGLQHGVVATQHANFYAYSN